MNNKIDDCWEDNGIDSIDNRINEVAVAELDGMEDDLDHMDLLDDTDFKTLLDRIKEMFDDCSRSEVKKIGKLLIKLNRKDYE